MSRNIWKLGKEFTDQVSAISYGVIKNHFYDKWVPRKSLLELTINLMSINYSSSVIITEEL